MLASIDLVGIGTIMIGVGTLLTAAWTIKQQRQLNKHESDIADLKDRSNGGS